MSRESCIILGNADFALYLGDDQQIDALKEILDTESIFARKLATGVAYHSPHMQQIADDYLSAMGSLELGDQLMGCQTMVSSVSTFRRRSSPFLVHLWNFTPREEIFTILPIATIRHQRRYARQSQILGNLYHEAMLTPRLSSGDKPKRDIQRA